MTIKHPYLGTVVLGVAVGIILGLKGVFPVPKISVTWQASWIDSGSFSPSASSTGGEELVLVYLGAWSCPWSNVDGLRDAVRSIRDDWHRVAQDSGKGFATVGIAPDVSVDEGVEHLAKYGSFDEVIVGRGWLNVGMMKYVYGDIPGPAATPQVLIIERTIHRVAGQTWISDEKVVRRLVGADEILENLSGAETVGK